ncbi:ankyrin repeat domain 34Bb [Nerophis ophidion]|uniref:ankyrin repeat domain 34Bb n=1 Tax=Nerophis ophidion TaxID=159077 RepID=UPI002ADFB46B|nr:ankyrin repeat domain 34Bb [Nerophis ophidion]
MDEVRTDGNSLLKAIYLSRLRLTRLLLEGGAYINESNEHGETPLMVACKTRHSDTQSVPKHKMVQYLLENGADPNIQDKSGKTALMHACLCQAGSETLSLLLGNGADPTLQDNTGLSAVVYAIHTGNRDIVKILLDACKAKGKEVIIIATDKLASGHQSTKQYLNVPPPSDPEERFYSAPTGSSQRRLPPQGSSANASPQPESTKNSNVAMGEFQPGSPGKPPSPLCVDKRLGLQRLHSEQWSKGPSLLLQKRQSSLLTEEQVEEDLSLHRPPISTDVKDGLLNNMSGDDNKTGSGRRFARKMSYDSSSSHPNLHQENNLSFSTCASDRPYDSLRHFNISSLQNVIFRRNIGADHYSSDSQLLQLDSKDRSSKGAGPARPKMANSRSSTLSGSRESLDYSVSRRGSGALLQDHIASTRPGYLPPLNPYAPIPDIGVSCGSLCPSAGSGKAVSVAFKDPQPALPCVFPRDLKSNKMLWRRHSMQSEQIKQLANFEEK